MIFTWIHHRSLNGLSTRQKNTSKTKMKNMVLRTTVVAWLCVQTVYGQGSSCNIKYTEDCAERVVSNFTDKVVREKREFTILLRTNSGEETIADCHWLLTEKLNCDPAKGYTCDSQLSSTFSVVINKCEKCIKSGEFLFEVAHEEIFSCKIETDKMNSGNTSANPESQNECMSSIPETTNGVSEQENNTWRIIGVVCPCLSAGAVALLLVVKRKKLLSFVRKRKRHKGNCVKHGADETAFNDFEIRKVFTTETADSAKTNPLEKQDAVFEALLLRPGINYEMNKTIISIHPTEHDAAFDVT